MINLPKSRANVNTQNLMFMMLLSDFAVYLYKLIQLVDEGTGISLVIASFQISACLAVCSSHLSARTMRCYFARNSIYTNFDVY